MVGAKVGRPHRVHRGVYAVGHRKLTWHGQCMAAVLRCEAGIEAIRVTGNRLRREPQAVADDLRVLLERKRRERRQPRRPSILVVQRATTAARRS